MTGWAGATVSARSTPMPGERRPHSSPPSFHTVASSRHISPCAGHSARKLSATVAAS